jgi:peptidoglycan/LPS O-acetylase OafA/YrhL
VRTPHIPALDGLRGVAIAMVVVFHFVALPTTGPAPTVPPLEALPIALARLGWAGVDVFFVLSGFLITGLLVDTRGTAAYYRRFYVRRALRIWPLYFAVVTAFTLLLPLLARSDPAGADTFAAHAAWYWTHTVNWLLAVDGWSAAPFRTYHFWSLAVEEQFYLVWPLVVALCPPRRLGTLCVAIVGAAVAFRLAATASGVSPTVLYVSTLTRAEALALGGALAVAARSPRAWAHVAAAVRPLAHASAAGWSAALGVAALAVWAVSPGLYPYASRAMQSVGAPLVACFAAIAIAAVLTAPEASFAARFSQGRLLGQLGRISYGVYMVHLPLLYLLEHAGFGPSALPRTGAYVLPGRLLLLAAAGSASIAVAALSWTYFERPLLALKERVAPLALTPRHAPEGPLVGGAPGASVAADVRG